MCCLPDMDIELQVGGVHLTLLEGQSKPVQRLPAEGLAGGCQSLTLDTYGSLTDNFSSPQATEEVNVLFSCPVHID